MRKDTNKRNEDKSANAARHDQGGKERKRKGARAGGGTCSMVITMRMDQMPGNKANTGTVRRGAGPEAQAGGASRKRKGKQGREGEKEEEEGRR